VDFQSTDCRSSNEQESLVGIVAGETLVLKEIKEELVGLRRNAIEERRKTNFFFNLI